MLRIAHLNSRITGAPIGVAGKIRGIVRGLSVLVEGIPGG